MKDPARLIIPVWGERYVSNVLSVTLPAILAPGNLPALCEDFQVELVIVTESRLFDAIRDSGVFRKVAKICATQLVPVDDLLTDVPGDYGMVLTYALFRGFADLGARVTRTYLVLVNADFIISDGSLRHLGTLMGEGHRIIHAPSFRVVLEDVWPQLQARVDVESCHLQMSPREMVRLALGNKHPTVKVRTVNQRICHQYWMDQYYWYVDENTMIGYQSPVALVAVKLERVVTEPNNFWDYGFLPEAVPNATPVFITDSDDFFMIEPQNREADRGMVRIGWFSLDDMARRESLRATERHRESARQLLKIHAADLPPDIDRFARESRAYMEGLYQRLSQEAAPHLGHPVLSQWFDEAKERRRGLGGSASQATGCEQTSRPALSAGEAQRSAGAATAIFKGLKTIYRDTFGAPPQVGRFHPLWVDLVPINERTESLGTAAERNVLWVGSSALPLGPPADDRFTLAKILDSDQDDRLTENAPYDVCICQLTVDEFLNLNSVYAKLRPLMKDGGRVVVHVFKNHNLFDSADVLLRRMVFPDVDISDIHFFGTTATTFLRFLHLRASESFPKHPIVRALVISATLVLLAPAVRFANARAARRNSAIFSSVWTSLIVDFTVRRSYQPHGRRPA